MLLAWAPTQQEDVAAILKQRFLSWSLALKEVLFFRGCSSIGSSSADAENRGRFVHKLMLNYARDQVHQFRPSLK
jgi:hypothetical protein